MLNASLGRDLSVLDEGPSPMTLLKTLVPQSLREMGHAVIRCISGTICSLFACDWEFSVDCFCGFLLLDPLGCSSAEAEIRGSGSS